MKCPTCGENTPDAWEKLKVRLASHPIPAIYDVEVRGRDDSLGRDTRRIPDGWVVVDYMTCANWKCGELVMRMHETRPLSKEPNDERELDTETHTWVIRPRFVTRPIEPEVGEPYRADYLEAAALLAISPRMSAVLSRRLLYDLLQQYAGIAEYTLKGSIDAFIADVSQPRRVRESLHLLREMGDFGAHTQTDDQAQIVNVTQREAEWTLEIIDRLFEHFIVSPARDQAMHEEWNQKLEATGRKAIPPLPEDIE